ncbi:MAG: hypothetical protein AVDCRST_MAG67-3130, partial [uncultured Solirubrobacteraceae bacterium]
ATDNAPERDFLRRRRDALDAA